MAILQRFLDCKFIKFLHGVSRLFAGISGRRSKKSKPVVGIIDKANLV